MIAAITQQKDYKLRIDLEDFERATRYAEYSRFKVDDASKTYKLTLGSYTGNAGMY